LLIANVTLAAAEVASAPTADTRSFDNGNPSRYLRSFFEMLITE